MAPLSRTITWRYLWRAVDQDGVVLDIVAPGRRDGAAAKRFFKRLLRGLQFTPRVLITDKLKGCGSDSYPLMASSLSTSGCVVVGGQAAAIVSSAQEPSRRGERRRAPKAWVERCRIPCLAAPKTSPVNVTVLLAAGCCPSEVGSGYKESTRIQVLGSDTRLMG